MSRTKSRLQLAAIVIVSIVVLFGVVGYFAIPAAARWGIENVAARETGRNVHVDSISANPYTLRITINGLTVDGLPGEAAPLLTVQRVTVNASISSVLRLAPVIDAVSINGLAANIVRLEAQRFNFDDIIERLRAKPLIWRLFQKTCARSPTNVHQQSATCWKQKARFHASTCPWSSASSLRTESRIRAPKHGLTFR